MIKHVAYYSLQRSEYQAKTGVMFFVVVRLYFQPVILVAGIMDFNRIR